MFKVSDVKKAFAKLFKFYNAKEWRYARKYYKEVIQSLDPELLCKKYNEEAGYLYDYTEVRGEEEMPVKVAQRLFDQKAAFVAMVIHEEYECGTVHIVPSTELWLRADKKLVRTETITVNILKEDQTESVVRYKRFIGIVEKKEDMFMDLASLICYLDDEATFYSLR